MHLFVNGPNAVKKLERFNGQTAALSPGNYLQ